MNNQKNFATTLAKLKTRAHWRVELYPAEFNATTIASLPECRQIVADASVHFRGWDIPHVPQVKDDKQDIYTKDGNRAESWIDWHIFKEVWRMYQSGKFTFLDGLNAQWYDEYDGLAPNPVPNLEPGIAVDIIDTIYTLTEVMHFVHNLVAKMPDVENWVLKITLNNVEGKKLHLLDQSRVPLHGVYESHSQVIPVLDVELSRTELKDTKLCERLAKEGAQQVFTNFDWQTPDVLIEGEQEKLVNKRFF